MSKAKINRVKMLFGLSYNETLVIRLCGKNSGLFAMHDGIRTTLH